MDDLASMTGETNFKAQKQFDEISLDGNIGKFYLRPANGKKDETTGKWPKEDMGIGVKLRFDEATGDKIILETTGLKVIILKIRRRLSYFSPNVVMNTNEHNTKKNFVVVYGSDPKDSGIASEVWERQKERGFTMKTQQILYCYVPSLEKVVKVIAKGGSLMSEDKVKNEEKFYGYLKSFTDDDHFYNFVTELVPVEEQGPKDKYFAFTFKRRERISPEMQETINGLIRETHQSIVTSDEAFASRSTTRQTGGNASESKDELAKEFEPDTITYPDDEINPEDIPF
jgi:hypothetical protein